MNENNREAEELIGTVLDGKYELEAVVGRGGFGVVYRARHLIWDQTVAVKILTKLAHVPEEKRDELLETFVREGRLLSALSSRTTGIVQARDIGTLTTKSGLWMPYMVLEWLDGMPLSRALKIETARGGRRRDFKEIFQIFDGAARALAVAHAHGVAHRDIKPPNIYVLGDSLAPGVVIKLLDFGIAKVMQTHTLEALEVTDGSQSVFTPAYGAPEQFVRTFGASGPWTDVFSMALVLLEVATGQRVFKGETIGELALRCLDPKERPTPRTLGLTVPDEIERVFRRALEVKVEDRYPNLGMFWLELVDALEIDAYPPLPLDSRTDGLAGASSSGNLRRPTASGSPNPIAGLHSLRVANEAPNLKEPALVETEVQTGTHASMTAPPPSRRAPWIVGGAVIAAAATTAVVLMLLDGSSTPSAEDGAQAPALAAAATPPDEPSAGASAGGCPEGMAFIPGGKFFMGSDDVDLKALEMARPAHRVEVGDFCLGTHEVRVADYRRCSEIAECKRVYRDSFWPQGSASKAEWKRQRDAMSPLCNGDDPERDQHPVNCVTWEQADAYCKWIGGRLPSEAEWEYAARGSDGRTFPWGDQPPSPERVNGCGSECVAWRKDAGLDPTPTLYDADDGYAGTAPVGSFPAGATDHGLHDIIGNLFEWTADAYRAYDDPNPGDPARRVIRGGAFNSYQPEHAYPALRYPQAADAHAHGIGFRCAADPKRTGA
ncbi:MAG: bifunctional serine/threonine-protein kinase/formylglycine-generating enzyme family protein [Nannocystaceae bacterium]